MNTSKAQKLYTGAQVRAMDAAAIEHGTPGIVLMKRAGRAAFEWIAKHWPGRSLCIVCGGGNNGGDGYVVAALAVQVGVEVELYYLKAPETLKNEAKLAADFAAREGVMMQPFERCLERPRYLESNTWLIVDALLGTGAVESPRPEFEKAISWINACAVPVFAIDVPSGLNADSGVAGQTCVRAEATMAFIGDKRGLYTADGPEFCGDRLFDDLGVAPTILNSDACSIELLKPWHLRAKLRRKANSHKGAYGHVAVLGGDHGMAGAPAMAAEASLYSGAGLTSLYTRQENAVLAQTRLPEIMARGVGQSKKQEDDLVCALAKSRVICVGPGLGQSVWSEYVLSRALASNKPMVIDADALNIIANARVKLDGQQHILTPHPGEAARLLGVGASTIQADRFAAVKAIQQQFGGVVVLKGAGTLIFDGNHTWVSPYGNAGMAVGGMGDVLAGSIAALLAQGLSLLEAAQLGVAAHSAAADLIVSQQGQIGLRATELTIHIRSILNEKTDIPG